MLAFADHVLEVLHSRGGVHLLRHYQRLGIKIERDHAVGAGSCRRDLHLTLGRFQIGAGIGNGLDVDRRSAAAAAHNAHAILGDEFFVPLRQRRRRETVMRHSAHVLGQASVG